MGENQTTDGEAAGPETSTREPGRRWPEALRSLRHRDFRRFWLGLIVSVMGTWMQMVAQGWLVLELTGSALYLGFVGACATAPMLLFTLPAGVVADRLSKRKILLVTQSLAMVQAFTLAALTYWGAVEVWHVMTLAACLGTVNAFDMPTRHAMVIDLVGREDVRNAVPLNSSAFNTGRIIGPAVAGVLVASAGIPGCFLVNGFTFIPMLVVLAFMSPLKPALRETNESVLHQIKEGLRWVRGQRVAMALLGMIAVTSVFAMPQATLLPLFAKNVFHMGPKGYGYMMSAYGLGALCSAVALTVFSNRLRLGALVTVGSFLFPVALLSLMAAPRYSFALGSLFLVGMGMMLFNAVVNIILQKAPPDELRGRVMSLRTFLFAGMMPLGNLQIGAVGEWLGPRAAVGIGGLVCLTAAIVLWWRVPRVRQSD